MTESYIQHSRGSTAIVGPDAMALMRAATIASALRMHIRTGGRLRLTRTATPTAMMRAAAQITGKTYKARDYAAALADMEHWCATMRAALPVLDHEGNVT